MIWKRPWMILPYEVVANLPNLCLSPLGVIPQCNWQPCTITDYTFSSVNNDTVLLTKHMPLQFGWALCASYKKSWEATPHLVQSTC